MSLRLREIVRRALLARRVQAPRSTQRRVVLETLEVRALMTTSDPLAGFLTGPNASRPIDIATNYLAQNGDLFGFSAGDASRLIVTDEYASPSGTTHLYLQQGYNGIGVENARISVAISRLGEVMFVGGDFVRGLGNLPSADAPAIPTLTAAQAIVSAASQLGLNPTGPLLSISDPAGIAQSSSFTYPGVSIEPIPAQLDFVGTDAGVRQAWALNFNLVSAPDFHWYDLRVDAETGQILTLNDWVSHATDPSQLNVYALPGVSPDDGPRQILSDPSDPVASPFGWFDRNGFPGTDTTETNGANVNAYLDLQGTGSGNGPRADGGPALIFNFPVDFTLDPLANANASITNQFYVNNIVHDVQYKYGFTEVAGNFQVNNYGKGGLGNDALRAANQYGSLTGSFNNAFMATPPDGKAPLQAMFLWNSTITGQPQNPNRDGSFDAHIIIHEYSHGTTNRLTGGPANSNALGATQSDGMGEGWSDWFSLMFTQLATDGFGSVRPLVTYSLGQPTNGPGIRTFPYSYNLNVNPRSIGGYNSNGEVHDTGEIWAGALWDLTVILTDKYGYSPDLAAGYTGAGSSGNQLAMQLVMDALKLQPANPSFSDARNAILMADTALTGGQNQYEIWTAFARRGMGFSFDDGGDSDSLVVVEAFDMPSRVFVQPSRRSPPTSWRRSTPRSPNSTTVRLFPTPGFP